MLHIRCQTLPSQYSEDAAEVLINPTAGNLSHGICEAKITEVEEYERLKKTPHTSKYDVDNCEKLHQDCRDGEKLDLRLLVACKQIYQEAKLIPYSTNIFSFSKPFTFDRFLSTRLPGQLGAISGLQFTLVLVSMEGQKWNKGFTNRNVKSLTGLRTLHVCIKQKPEHLCSYNDMKAGAYDAVNGLLILRCYHLSAVTVVLSDDYIGREGYRLANPNGHPIIWHRAEARFRWTADQKRDYAEFLKGKLLKLWDGDARSNELKALNMQKLAFENERWHLQAKLTLTRNRYQSLITQYAAVEDDLHQVQSRIDEIADQGY